ncbi:MAG: hypothetical protein M1133_01380 [Armatimonadetes bacterium]|nr:hypothetical protein [Armatimonadota bacterium]
MLDTDNWPNWLHVLRLLFALSLTAGFGIHAFYRHKQEIAEAVSARTWMYWLYSMVFLLASAANFTQLYTTLAFHSYQRASLHLGYSTLLLVLSYMAVLAGVKRRPYY